MKREYQTMMEHINVPDGLNDRVLQAVRAAETPRRRGRVWKTAVCAACALALVVGSVHLRPGGTEDSLPRLSYEFVLTAYAADTGETVLPNANGGLAFCGGSASYWSKEGGYYSDSLFQITGEGIQAVTLALNRGELYRLKALEHMTEEEQETLQRAKESGTAVPGTFIDGDEENHQTMMRLGSSVTEDYDSDISYGFWCPAVEDADAPDGVSRLNTKDSLDTLNGAQLWVSVLYADGTKQEKAYTLSTGSLKAVWNQDGTKCLLPGLAGEDETQCFYGIYAVSESDSRWFQWPVQGANTISLSNDYGDRWNPGGQSKTFHSGIDIPAESGTPVLAAADGTVTETGYNGAQGNYLLVNHGDGLTTLYAHCESVDVAEGDTVKAGESIAAVGSTGKSTGPHLHFEVRQDGTAQNPTAYFDADTRAQLRMG